MITIKQAKINLYHLLLTKQTENLSTNEIDLMFCLSKDSDIQDILTEHKDFNEH